MKNKNIKTNIFGLTTVFAVAFLIFCFGFSLITSLSFINFKKNTSETLSHISNKIYAEGVQYNLTVIVDDNFESVEINGNEIDLENFSHNYEENQTIKITYALNAGYEFAEYIAYETGSKQNSVAIIDNQFIMPSHNVTLEIKRKHNIKIYKVFYENKVSVRESLFENVNFDSGENYSLDFNIDTNYHFFTVNQKYYGSINDNVSLENTTLIIDDVQADDIIRIYFEKNYYSFRVYCGTNEEANDGLGGRFSLKSSDGIFSPIPAGNNSMVANVYYGQDITLTIVNYNPFQFHAIFVYNENQVAEGFDTITSINAENEITIKNVTSKIYVYIQFIETYRVTIQTSAVNIDNNMIKIGQSGFEVETLSYDDKYRYVVKNGSVSVETIIDKEYDKVYEFKYWKIFDNQNQEIADISIFGITENNLLNNILSISNIQQELYLKAIYGIKNRTVNVAWNGKNGTIECDIEHNDYLYTIKYGDDITFVLKPTDDMRFLKSVVLSGNNNIQSENFVEQTETQDGFEYKISNITENLTLAVQFVVNTWWEHIDVFEFEGKGTKEEPYLIKNANDLALISYNLNNGISQREGDISFNYAYYLVKADIDCGTDYYFVPIGTQSNPFNGTFDYAFHSIKNLITERDIELYQYDGLFDVIGEFGKIVNRYRTYTILVITLVGSAIFLLTVIRIVLAVEKRRNKPKKVITLNNYKNYNMDE